MCWNADISLNTFLFSFGVLALIYYNNTYTKYKTGEFDNPWLYVFLFLVIVIQLIEFFIWRNLNNKEYNRWLSIAGMAVLFLQPISSLMLLSDEYLRNICIVLYSLISIPSVIIKMTQDSKNIKTTVVNKHLYWNFNFVHDTFLMNFAWFFFFFFSFFFEKRYIRAIFGIALFLVTIFYSTNWSFGSMWCWSVNFGMMFYAARLLFYLPFVELTTDTI